MIAYLQDRQGQALGAPAWCRRRILLCLSADKRLWRWMWSLCLRFWEHGSSPEIPRNVGHRLRFWERGSSPEILGNVGRHSRFQGTWVVTRDSRECGLSPEIPRILGKTLMSRRRADQGSWKSPSAMRSSQKEVVVETVRYRVVTSWGSFVLIKHF
uniref:Uncharacterized protein n=1 Tax=Fagus sylvatica TaxID=28930 RepID=A0A2N9FGG6_FAGSY